MKCIAAILIPICATVFLLGHLLSVWYVQYEGTTEWQATRLDMISKYEARIKEGWFEPGICKTTKNVVSIAVGFAISNHRQLVRDYQMFVDDYNRVLQTTLKPLANKYPYMPISECGK